MQYPVYHPNRIVQYDEHVFVWMDETGTAGGIAPNFEAARIGQDEAAAYLAAGPDWVNLVPDDTWEQFPPIEGNVAGVAAVLILVGAIFAIGLILGAWLF